MSASRHVDSAHLRREVLEIEESFEIQDAKD
jgi:hypothetical protein